MFRALLALTALQLMAQPRVCEQCHREIAANFSKTGMGRSFSHVRALAPGATFYHEASDVYYSMISRDGRYYQRRWQIGFNGAETNVEEKRVDFVLGSGNHGQTLLHLTERNTLQQLPLGWYAEKGGYWAMNPGYDRPDNPASIRTVSYECMFCHNGYPQIPKSQEEKGAEPQFSEVPEGIDCQRCHGPGQKHVEAAGRAGATSAEIRAAIVNPRRLTSEREIDVCLQCHLETTSRALPGSLQRQGRGPFSYVPGQPLTDFREAFDRATPDLNQSEVAQSAYRLMRSQCFLKSAGKLRCTTCHDPHEIARGEMAQAKYNGICRNCHQAIVSTTHAARADCIDCHMPKRRTDDAVHIVMTDHWIQKRKPAGDLLAAKAEVRETPTTAYRGEVVRFYPPRSGGSAEDALDLALAQVRDGSNLQRGLPELANLIARYHPTQAGYYEGLADGYRSAGDGARAAQYFDEAVRHAPSSAILLLKLGNTLTDLRQFATAEVADRRAVALAPNDPLAWGQLGWALWQQDKTAEAKADIEKAIALDPEVPELHNNLGSLLLGTRDLPGALKQFRAAIALEPGLAEWQTNLGRLLASRAELPEARYRFEQSIRLQPNGAGAAEAHEGLGLILSDTGDAAGALRELSEAVRLLPGFGRAHYELGMALWQAGDKAAALEQFRLAAQSDDGQVQTAAREFLQKQGH